MKPSAAVLLLLDKMERSLGLAAANCCKFNEVEVCPNTKCPFYDTCPLTAKTAWRTKRNLGSLGCLENASNATYFGNSESDWGQEGFQKNT